MTYSAVIYRLLQCSLFGGVKLGLSNVQRLLHRLGNPENQFKTVHIAGTNGKGSTAAKIAKGLEASGYKTGLFTSPHISSFRERIQINGTLIPEQDAADILSEIFAVQDKIGITATFFELSTVLAFCYFAKACTDFAVIETGLGGRLDATNVISPEIALITSIDYDHTEILGDTIPKITQEKAGIIKRRTPIVIGPSVPLSVIEPIAFAQSSPLYTIDENFNNFEAENRAIARKVMEVLGLPAPSIEIGLNKTPPCRFERIRTAEEQMPIILDVAHNPAGFKRLFQRLRLEHPGIKPKLILGLSLSKDLKGCLDVIHQHAESIHLVQASNGRGAPTGNLKELLLSLKFPMDKLHTYSSIRDSIFSARAQIDRSLWLITGSFFIMGEARRALGINEPSDSADVNERSFSSIS